MTYGPAHNHLGQLYFERQDDYQVAWEFEYARKLMPERPEPLCNLGQIDRAVGKLDRAVEYYEKAYALQPDHPRILGALAHARRGR